VPIGDAIWTYAASLRSHGYRAFDAYQEFLESFGDADEVDLHRRCAVEVAKIRIGQPWPMRFSADERKHLYSSILLSELQKKRDKENGCNVSELEKTFPSSEELWRREVDPCHRNKTRYEVNDRSQYQLRWDACMKRQREMIEREAKAHERLSNRMGFEMEDRLETFNEVMESEVIPLGFTYDKRKARGEFSVYSKRLSANWDLCWTLQYVEMFAMTPHEGYFSPNLDLRRADIGGDPDKAKAYELLLFRYQHMLPGFGSAYCKFRSLAELRLVISAHIQMYRLMAPTLEQGIASTELYP